MPSRRTSATVKLSCPVSRAIKAVVLIALVGLVGRATPKEDGEDQI